MHLDRYSIIKGYTFEDVRGDVTFSNEFDMTDIKRHYVLIHKASSVTRAWQGHKCERKWMKCIEGSFTINLIKPLDVNNPNGKEKIDIIILNAQEANILFIPGGYFTGLKANNPFSTMIVFSDFFLNESKNDDIRKAQDFWLFKTKE